MTDGQSPRRVALVAGACMAALSLCWSWGPSYWFDEAASLSAVRRPWSSLWELVHHIDAVHFVYYSTLRGWTTVFGTSAFATRALSALLLGLCSVFAVLIAHELFSRRVAAWTGAIMLMLPGLTWAGFDARSSAFSCAAFAAATWCLLRARADDTRRWWVLYVAVIALTVFVQVLTCLGLMVHLVLMRDHLRKWLWHIAVLTPLLAFIAIAHAQQGQLAWLRVTPVDGAVSVLFSQEVLGMRTPDHAWPVLIGPVLLALGCWLLLLFGVLRRPRVPAVLVWAFAPAAVALGWSLVSSPVYQERYFAWCVPAFAMLVATGVDVLWTHRRRAAMAALFGIAVAAVPVTVAQRGPAAKYGQDYRSVANFVQAQSSSSAALLTVTPQSHSAQIVYPEAFSRVVDFSTRETPARSGTMFGIDRTPTTALARARARGYRRIILLHEFNVSLRAQPVYASLTAHDECRMTAQLQVRRTSAAVFVCPAKS